MNNNKRLKPNLLDPLLEKKIIKTLKPNKPDYWAPTKNSFRNFYNQFIQPNISLIIFIIFILIILWYRYRTTKKERMMKRMDKIANEKLNLNHTLQTQNVPIASSKKPNNNNINVEQYTKLLLDYYNQEKEYSREPGKKKDLHSPNTKFAYPMYPYSKGSLVPSGSRK